MNTKKTMKNMFRKITTAGLALLSAISIMPASVSASADYTYMIAPLMDVKNHKLQTYVVQDSSGKENYFVNNKLYLSEGDTKLTNVPNINLKQLGKNVTLNGQNNHAAINNTSEFSSFLNEGDGKAHYLVFPGADGGKEKTSTEYDYQEATFVANTLSTSLNSAISFIVDEGHYDMTNYSSAQGFADFLTAVVNGSLSGYQFEYGLSTESDETFRAAGVTVDTSDQQMGNTKYNYVKITNESTKESRIFQYRVPKGYTDGQYLNNILNSEYTGDDAYGNGFVISKYVSWQGLSFYSIVAAGARNLTANDQGEKLMYSDDNDSLTSSINKMFFNLIQRMASTLGMYTLSDLILNTGTRSTAYYQGIMPYSWFRGANIVFWIAQVAAFFTLLFGLLKMIIDRNISVVGLGKSNSKASFDLKQGSLDFMKAIILMMLFVPVFYLLTSLNGYVVQTCAALAKNTSFIDLAGSSSLAGLIINLAYLGILIKLNVDFLIRAVTCTVLYSMSPLAISSLVIGNNKGSLFNTWSRELICNIFLQTFDAVIFVFFATMIGSGTSNTIERITLCYAFIPLNKWFKDNLMGFRGVGGSEAAEEAGKNERGMFANLGMGAMGLASVGLTRAGQNAARKVTENNDEIASLRAQQKNEKLYGQQEKVTAADELMGNVVGAKNVNQNKLRGALDAVGEKHNQEVRARNELRQQKIDALENKNKDLRRWSAGFGGANNLVGATALMGGIAASGAGDNTKAAFDMAVGKGFANAMDENIVAAKGKTGMEASAELINSKIKTTPLPGQEKPLDAEQLIKQTSPNSNIAEMGYSGERGVNLFKHKDGTYTKDRHAGNDNQPAVGFEINTNEYDAGKVKGMLQEKGVTVAEGKGGKLCAIYDGASTDDKGNVTNMSNRLVDLSSCAKNAYDGNYSAPTEGQINARENPVEPVYDNVGKKVSDPVLVGDRTPEQINPKLSPDARAYVQTPAVKAEIGNEVLKPIKEQPAEPPLSRSKGSAGKSYSKGNRSGDSGKQNGGTSGKDKAEKKTPNSNKK